MGLNLPIVCARFLVLTCLCAVGCSGTHSVKPDTVIVPRTEYEQLKADSHLLREYEKNIAVRKLAIEQDYHKKFPSLFNACGDPLGPDGNVFDPKNYPETSNRPKEQSQLQDDGNQGSQPETSLRGGAQANVSNGATQSFWLNVDSVLRFAHQEKCGEEYCDGFFLMAHDQKRQYGLMCVTHVDGESAWAREYNAGSIEQQHCGLIHTGKWRVTLSNEHMAFYSDPQTMAALYRVTSEQ